jgi:hypothetical protein
MCKSLITATVAVATLVVALIADVTLTKFFTFAASNALLSAAAVDGKGKPPPEPACWDDKSGQPHCHA